MFLLILIEFLLLPWLPLSFAGVINSENDLPFGLSNRLESNLVLFDSNECSKELSQWDELNLEYFHHRQQHQMTQQFSQKFSKVENASQINPIGCTAVCLSIGTTKELISYPLPAYIYSKNDDFVQWHRLCSNIEIGIISYYEEAVIVHSVNPVTNERFNSFTFQPNSLIWSIAPLCIKQEITTLVGTILLTSSMCHSGILVVPAGDVDSTDSSQIFNLPLSTINTTIQNNWKQSQDISRTFTKYGFEKLRLSNELWNSISSYYYNNRYSLSNDYQQFDNLHTINWWNRSSTEQLKKIEIPPILYKYWSQLLCLYVEMWSQGSEESNGKLIPKPFGQKLQSVSSSGFRVFSDTSYQLPHVEDMKKIAFSVIVNVDQKLVFTPWVAQLYDSFGRLHEITMSPGDILVYEVTLIPPLSSSP
jgi:hypothetical protein